MTPGEVTLMKRRYNARIRFLENELIKRGMMETAPCFICGYAGPDYFNPQVHACAVRHHKLRGKV